MKKGALEGAPESVVLTAENGHEVSNANASR